MSGFVGVLVSDPGLQSQFTQVELRGLKSKFLSVRTQSGKVTLEDLPPVMVRLKNLSEAFTEDQIKTILVESYSDLSKEIDFESFLRAYLNLQARAKSKMRTKLNSSTSFLKAPTTTLRHTISESEKTSYVSHINSFLGEDPFLKKYLPLDPSTNALFDLAKDGVLLWLMHYQDGEAYVHLLNVLAPEHGSANMLDTKDPTERANLIIEHAEKMDCKRYVSPKDIVEGSANLNLAFVAQIFQQRLV
ncbi:hypothetical protein U1Q18_001106 [Sarracenia purpurea var. burkii]